MRLRLFRSLFLAAAIIAAAQTASIRAQDNKPPTLRLALLIVVDQMRPDYLTRFDSLFTGGLAQLAHQGFVFSNTGHEHAHTETGVGHATIATGSLPSRHGIVGNSWYDITAGKSVYCVGDSTSGITDYSKMKGRSPANLRCSGIADWLNRGTPEAKVFSLALKDRAAITMGSYSADGVYWYNSDNGAFITSVFYRATYPQWLIDFNARRPAEDYYAGVWDRLRPLVDYRFAGPDSVVNEADGKDVTFPHNFSPRSDQKPGDYFDNLLATPFADHLSFRLAHDLVVNEGLGQDDVLDLLMIGCSAADYIGHAYGPQSQELEDYYLRLDQYLGEFFAFLDSIVGVDKYTIALSSDHGVLELPEILKAQGIDAGRISSDSLKSAIQAAGMAAGRNLGLKDSVVAYSTPSACYLRLAEAAALGLSSSELAKAVATELKKLSYVEDVYLEDEMSASGGNPREYLQLFRNNYFEGRSAPLEFRLKKNYIVVGSTRGTTHGSCYDYDCTVPIIFCGPGIKPGKSDQRVRSVDIAPTLADLLKLQFIGEPDGQSLLPLMKK